jgi:hypothetical protein
LCIRLDMKTPITAGLFIVLLTAGVDATSSAQTAKPSPEPSNGQVCTVEGGEWKNVLAQLAHESAVDFGRWEFTTDLVERDGKLVVSADGFLRCASRGRAGCPLVTEVLSAQDGDAQILNGDGSIVMDPPRVRSELIHNLAAQKSMEAEGATFTDEGAAAPYRKVQAGAFEHELAVVSSTRKACGGTSTSYRVTTAGDWRDARKKLITVGFGRGNDLLDVTLEEATRTISIDPYNVDFVPPTGETCTIQCRVKVTSGSSETWTASDDMNNLCPVGGECLKQGYNSSGWVLGIVKTAGYYRYCWAVP